MVTSGIRSLVFWLGSLPEIWPMTILPHQRMDSKSGARGAARARLSSIDLAEFHLFHR